MSDIERRVRRAARDAGDFEQRTGTTFDSTTTPFDGVLDVESAEEGRLRFEVTVRVPLLGRVTEDPVAEVVEEGWYETFELRVSDVGSVTARERDLDPSVRRESGEAVVEMAFEDIDERRGVDDAAALVDFVEGTYVQGIIPGYDYTEPVTGILASARRAGGETVER
jgi:hypothetical protein